GRLVQWTGDGVLATFDARSSALTCAEGINRALAKLGIEVRAGLHVGELDVLPGGDVRGIAVHIAARVLAQAGAGEIVVTGAVRDTARGSSFTFHSRGEVLLKGIGQLELLDAERGQPA